MAKKITVEILGDASSLERAFGNASKASRSFSSGMAHVSKMAAVAAGAAGVGALVGTLKVGFDEFMSASRAAAQTAAVLKSTGGVANVSAKQIDALANSLLRKSGIDDEAIQSGENMLLTFTNIRNEAGKGRDIFNQSTKAAVDMTAAFQAMGKETSVTDMALQLGKALNDPAHGMTRLQRIGVTFTESQKQAAKAMMEAGNTAGAQQIILRELQKEFGGSAEAAGKTLPGQLNILKESFNNLAGDLVSRMVPAFSGAVSFMTEKGLPAISAWANALGQKLQPTMAALGNYVTTALVPVLSTFGGFIRDTLGPIAQRLGEIFAGAMTRISGVVSANMPQIRAIFDNVGAVLRNVAEVVMPLVAFAFTKVLPAALQVAIPTLKFVTDILRGVSGAFRAIADAAMSTIATLLGLVDKFLGGIEAMAKVASHIPIIGGKFGAMADGVGRAREAVRSLQESIDALHDKNVTITAHVQQTLDAYHHRAGGGPVMAGVPYIVGEHRPELFVPRVSGYVLPRVPAAAAGMAAGGGPTEIHKHYHLETGDVRVNGVDELGTYFRRMEVLAI